MSTAASTSKWIATEPGVRRKDVAAGERLYQMLVHFDAGATTAVHSHPHEQVIHVITGRLRLLLSEGATEISADESICLAGNRPHGAEAPVETLVVDTFNPPREDLIAKDNM